MWCPLLGQTTKRTRPSSSSVSIKRRSSATGECSQRPPPSPERRTTLMRVLTLRPKKLRGISRVHSRSATSSFNGLLLRDSEPGWPLVGGRRRGVCTPPRTAVGYRQRAAPPWPTPVHMLPARAPWTYSSEGCKEGTTSEISTSTHSDE